MDCKHLVVQGRYGEMGSWCLNCGEKVLEVEWRECRFCANYKESADRGIPICLKKLMVVLPDMHVTYRVEQGTCWEELPIINTDIEKQKG